MKKSTDKPSNYKKLKVMAQDMGFDLFGVADITALREDFLLPDELKKKFSIAISLAKRLNDAVLEDISDHPTPLYFHHYRQMNFFLDRAAFLLADHIQALGYDALPIAASQLIDWEKQRGHLSHKHVGAAAGLGWIGRSNLLINPEHGARFRLVTILTDMPLDPDKPLDANCGPCQACLALCPAHAIKEAREDFDHEACYKKLTDFRNKGLVSQLICGVCVKSCRGPKNFRPATPV
jgi:epoxyqueuosine reductase QueG